MEDKPLNCTLQQQHSPYTYGFFLCTDSLSAWAYDILGVSYLANKDKKIAISIAHMYCTFGYFTSQGQNKCKLNEWAKDNKITRVIL